MLKQREVIYKISTDGSDFRVDFTPSTLNNQEVYEVKNEHGHYCYMTQEMVDKIFEIRPGSEGRYIDGFSFASDISRGSFAKLKNKILFDLPTTVNETTFSDMSFPFVEYDKNSKEKPVVLKIQKEYNLYGLGEDGGAIELILPDNKLECNNFNIYSKKNIDQILEINAKNNKMDVIFVDSLVPVNVGTKEVHLSVDFEDERATLFVQNAVIPSFSCKNGYINFKTGKNFHLQDAIVKTVFATKNLSNLHFSSSKDIEIKNSTVSLHHSAVRLPKDQNIGIKGNSGININDSICEIHDFVGNNGGLYVSQKKKGGVRKRQENQIKIVQSSFYSPTYLSTTKDRSLLVKESLVDNGEGKVTIDGGSLVLSSKILGNNNQPMTISCSSVRLSEIIDTNEVKWGYIFNTRLENCLIENHKSNKQENIFMGPQTNSAMLEVLNREDRDIKWVLKNCQIKLDKDCSFRAYNFEGGKIIAENSTFNKGFLFSFHIKEDKIEKGQDFTFLIKNSLMNNSAFKLVKSPDSSFMTTSISNSEINDTVVFTDLELLQNSVANYNTYLVGYKKVESCFLDGVEKEAREGEHELIGFNPNASSYVEEPGKNVGTATHDVEIL
jgi:hypothetical protein